MVLLLAETIIGLYDDFGQLDMCSAKVNNCCAVVTYVKVSLKLAWEVISWHLSCTCSIFLTMVEEYFFSPGWVRLVGQNIIKKYFFSPAWARYLWGIFLIYWLSLAGWAKYLHIFMKVVKPAMAFSDALLKYQGIATERKFCESSFEYYDNIGSVLHL